MVDTIYGSTMTASTMLAARMQLPEGTPASMNAGTSTSSPTKPYTTEGMPARRSMAPHSTARNAADAEHDRNKAHPMAMNSAIARATAEVSSVAAMIFAMPNDAPPPKSTGIQSLPSKNAPTPTSPTTGHACTATVSTTHANAAAQATHRNVIKIV